MTHSHLALARSRQDDFLREAERHRLAAAARRDDLTLRARFVAFLHRREPAPAEAPRVAPAAK
jgi:hypothetical protein